MQYKAGFTWFQLAEMASVESQLRSVGRNSVDFTDDFSFSLTIHFMLLHCIFMTHKLSLQPYGSTVNVVIEFFS